MEKQLRPPLPSERSVRVSSEGEDANKHKEEGLSYSNFPTSSQVEAVNTTLDLTFPATAEFRDGCKFKNLECTLYATRDVDHIIETPLPESEMGGEKKGEEEEDAEPIVKVSESETSLSRVLSKVTITQSSTGEIA
jgi:hypothetical protein